MFDRIGSEIAVGTLDHDLLVDLDDDVDDDLRTTYMGGDSVLSRRSAALRYSSRHIRRRTEIDYDGRAEW